MCSSQWGEHENTKSQISGAGDKVDGGGGGREDVCVCITNSPGRGQLHYVSLNWPRQTCAWTNKSYIIHQHDSITMILNKVIIAKPLIASSISTNIFFQENKEVHSCTI